MEPVLLVGAGLVAALAAITVGPLGALRVVSIRSHRLLDPVLGSAFALSPLITMHRLSVVGLVLAEVAAAVLWRLAFVRHPAPAPVAASPVPPLGVPSPPRPARPSPVPGQAARALGRGAGMAGRRAARHAARADRMLGRGARLLGGAVGRRSAGRGR